MSRIYTVSFAATVTSAGGDTDLLEVLPADDKPVKLVGFILGQTSEVGDAAEEGLRISVLRHPATVTSGNGTAATPQPMDSADSAAGFAAECNGTTVSTTSGTTVTLSEMAWNLRASPFDMWYPEPALRPKAKQGEALVVRMQTTLADDASFACTFFLEEE